MIFGPWMRVHSGIDLIAFPRSTNRRKHVWERAAGTLEPGGDDSREFWLRRLRTLFQSTSRIASEVWKKGHEATTTDDLRNAMSSELYPSHGWKDRNGDKSVACRRQLILR